MVLFTLELGYLCGTSVLKQSSSCACQNTAPLHAMGVAWGKHHEWGGGEGGWWGGPYLTEDLFLPLERPNFTVYTGIFNTSADKVPSPTASIPRPYLAKNQQ